MRSALFTAAVLAGCYTPELRDCTVTCASSADCAGDQVCGSDRFCAAPDVAGQCGGSHAVDAMPVEPPDGPPPPPDGEPPHAILRIELSGKGRVVVAGVGTCTMSPCDYSVVAEQALSLEAIPGNDSRFDKWEAGPCEGQGATCTATAKPPMTRIKARFKND